MNVFELYSGIGGMHFALKESGINFYLKKAIDINPNANVVYSLNFPQTILLQKNIQGLTVNDFNDINMILMSPPCQPHTRNGLQKDKMDERSESLLHLFTLIPELKTVDFILVENVKGFEISQIRNEFVRILSDNGFTYQEFLLSPVQFGIPNSRLRYYLLAKRKPMEFCFCVKNQVMKNIPNLKNEIKMEISVLNRKYQSLTSEKSLCYPIKQVLDNEEGSLIPENILRKYGTLLDIVTSESVKSCCFTKGYGHFVEGTGSVLSQKNDSDYVSKICTELKKCNKKSDNVLDLLKSLHLRYFTPKEISKLMSFPNDFKFPSHMTDKQKYKLLGNSINVHVVAILIKILVS